ncbi:T9SS type A sorting domain-containing protein, partial [Flavobacteriales bacterium]|nr:T9SS type A sorting domain-containing protein [Flavobacteriales bacterium]
TGTGPSGAHSGNNYFYYETSGVNPSNNSITSPLIDLSSGTDEAELSFWIHAFGATMGTLNIGVGNTSTGPFTTIFTNTGQIQTGNNDPYQNVGINLSSYLGQQIYLQLDYTSRTSFTGDVAIDLIEVSSCISCPSPSALSASNITANSADLSWVAGATETAWDMQYGSSGFTLGNGTTVGVSSNPYILTGLSASTTYDYYIKAICAPGDSSSWAGPYTFTTPCAALIPPQLEDFTSGFPPNTCWDQADDGSPLTGPNNFGTSSWTTDGFGNIGTTGAVKVNLFTTGINDWILTPQYDLSTGGPYQIEFDFGVFQYTTNNNGSLPKTLGPDDVVEVLISRDNGSSWNVLKVYDSSYVTAVGGNHETITLTNDTGIVQFAIWASEGTQASTIQDVDVMIDNFEIVIIPCQQPTALGASNITASSADLTWTAGGNETAWDIQYGSSGFSLGNGTVDSVNSNPYSLTGLSGSSTYDYYVKAICAPGDSSSWAGPFTFVTSCAPGTSQSVSSCNTYLWNNNVYDSSGVYIDTLQANNGCDSVVTLNLTINNPVIIQDVEVSCDSVFIWNGNPLYSSGIYLDTLQAVNTCDSVVKLSLTLNYTSSSLTTKIICEGDSIKFGSGTYSIAGLYPDTLQSGIGCDSISTLDLTVTDITVSIDTSQLNLVANITGGTGPFNYFWSNGNTSNTITPISNGLYSLFINDANGCVSNTAIYNFIFNTTRVISNIKDILNIYPNPNNGQFIITNSEPINEIFITDLQGKSVYTNENLNVNSLDIELHNLEKGMYLVNILTNNGMNIKTVVIH